MARDPLLLYQSKKRPAPLLKRLRSMLARPAEPSTARRRVVIGAIMIGIVAALIELPMPAEDAFSAARAELRTSEAPDDIVIVAVDDQTLNAIGAAQPSRRQDAAVVDRIFASGAARLVFDRAYADPGPAGDDEAFAAALKRYPGRVWLGASPTADNGLQQHAGLLPTPRLRDAAPFASMMGQSAPFGLAVRFPTQTTIDGKSVPSISALMADYKGQEGWYRPDQSIDPHSVPTLSFGDVLNGTIKTPLTGKTVVIAPTHLESSDFHALPFGGKIPGVYFHVMGAHTLKGGLPLDLLWIPALLLVSAALAAQGRRKRPSKKAAAACGAVLLLAPIAFDKAGINIDVFPAAIALGIGLFRLDRLAARTYNRSTNLLLPDSSSFKAEDVDRDIYALKLTNLGDFRESGISSELGQLVERIIGCLQTYGQVIDPGTSVAFDKDTLVWKAAPLDRSEIEEHALGLLAVLRAADGLGMNGARIDGAVGIDINHGLPLGARIQAASQAAEMATRNGLRVLSADAEFLADRERRVLLLAQMERCIEAGTIGVGYQPKVCLRSGEIVGAEALLRWKHHTLGEVDAAELVRVAEESDRIDQLSVYVLDVALAAGRKMLDKDPEFRLAVNMSAKALGNLMILYHVARLLSKHRFPAENLVLEVTETAPLDDLDVENHLEGLLKLGLQVSLDDFGTGHSSLEYLQRVPSSEIKIDRRFVTHMRSSDDNAALVEGTIEMAHKLGKDVVAEGVEDELTAKRLQAMGCDLAQGYYYSPAVQAEELIAQLERRRFAA